MSRIACVIHMSAVTLAQMTRNAPSVVRKIYRPMDPIRFTRPRSRQNVGAPGPRCPQRRADAIPTPFTLYLIRQQSGLAKAKPLSMHNKTLIWIVCRSGHRRRRSKPLRALTGPACEEVLSGAPPRRLLRPSTDPSRPRSAVQGGAKNAPFHVFVRVLANKFAQSAQA